jgi:hypothetical protein
VAVASFIILAKIFISFTGSQINLRSRMHPACNITCMDGRGLKKDGTDNYKVPDQTPKGSATIEGHIKAMGLVMLCRLLQPQMLFQ